jgi:hypothetical protein
MYLCIFILGGKMQKEKAILKEKQETIEQERANQIEYKETRIRAD